MVPWNNPIAYRSWTRQRRRAFVLTWLGLPFLWGFARALHLGTQQGLPEMVFLIAIQILMVANSFLDGMVPDLSSERLHITREFLLPTRVRAGTFVWGIFWSSGVARALEMMLWLPLLRWGCGREIWDCDLWFLVCATTAWLWTWAGATLSALLPRCARELGLVVFLLNLAVDLSRPGWLDLDPLGLWELVWVPFMVLMPGRGGHCGNWVNYAMFRCLLNVGAGSLLLGLVWAVLRSRLRGLARGPGTR